jgi:hypothetical protein
MRFLHVASLAALGWYLMIPPWSQNAVDITAPFNLWEQFASYDTASQCESEKRGLFISDVDGVTRASRAQRARLDDRAAQFRAARCISADDPRLAK